MIIRLICFFFSTGTGLVYFTAGNGLCMRMEESCPLLDKVKQIIWGVRSFALLDQSKSFFEAVPILFYPVFWRDILQVKLFTFTAHLHSIRIRLSISGLSRSHLWTAGETISCHLLNARFDLSSDEFAITHGSVSETCVPVWHCSTLRVIWPGY